MIRNLTALVGCLLIISSTVLADGIEITPFIGWRIGGDLTSANGLTNFSVDDSESYGATLDIEVADETKVDLLFSRQETSVDSGGLINPPEQQGLKIDYYHIGGLKEFGYGEPFRPYFVGALGATRFAPDRSGDDYFFSFSLGGGFKWLPSKHIGIRVEGRLYGTLAFSSGGTFCANGCTAFFSGDAFWQVEGTAGLIFAF